MNYFLLSSILCHDYFYYFLTIVILFTKTWQFFMLLLNSFVQAPNVTTNTGVCVCVKGGAKNVVDVRSSQN